MTDKDQIATEEIIAESRIAIDTLTRLVIKLELYTEKVEDELMLRVRLGRGIDAIGGSQPQS